MVRNKFDLTLNFGYGPVLVMHLTTARFLILKVLLNFLSEYGGRSTVKT